MAVQSRLDKLDLSILNAFVPDLNIGGAATGSLDFSQPDAATFPTMDARLDIANFTRSGIAAVSTPVAGVFNGRLLPEGGDAPIGSTSCRDSVCTAVYLSVVHDYNKQ